MKAGTHTSLFRIDGGHCIDLHYTRVVRECGPEERAVTLNPTSGNSYSLEQEVEYGQKAIPEIERELTISQFAVSEGRADRETVVYGTIIQRFYARHRSQGTGCGLAS